MLIAADPQVRRTHANFSVKDSESDGELAAQPEGWRFMGEWVERGGIPPHCTQSAPQTGHLGGSWPADAQ